MSRIGRLPITLPAGVTVTVAEDNMVKVKGPKGELAEKINSDIKVEVGEDTVTVTRPNDEKEMRALHGLTRALIANMVHGVTQGFEKALEIIGVGYRAQKSGKKIVLTIGYSHPVEVLEDDGVTFDVPTPNTIVVKGISKQKVGQIASDIRSIRPPEPYKGKGIKYKGEYIQRKVGKTGIK
ncbi:MAG: 50S ribosomal protein L6 [Eubacteriales bacterium]